MAECRLQQRARSDQLVWMNSPGPSIERSTWLSAEMHHGVGPIVSKHSRIYGASVMSARTKA